MNQQLIKLGLLFSVVVMMITGCAKSSSTTVVQADGSWNREVKLTLTKNTMGGEDKWPEIFTLPKGPEWKISDTVKGEDKIITLSRPAKLGEEPLTDIIVRVKEQTLFKNYVTVTDLGDGKYKYYEKIVWTGPKDPQTNDKIGEFVKAYKESLPAGLATDKDAEEAAIRLSVKATRLMFGPDDHLLGMMMTTPEGAIRRLKSSIGDSLNTILLAKYGDKLTDAQRLDAIRKMYASLDSLNTVDKEAAQKDPNSKESSDNLVGMSMSVKLPGKILAHNGTYDSVSGEIYWDMFSISAMFETVELTATCQIEK